MQIVNFIRVYPLLPHITPILPHRGNAISSTILTPYPLFIYIITFLNEYIYREKCFFTGIINSLYIYSHGKR